RPVVHRVLDELVQVVRHRLDALRPHVGDAGDRPVHADPHVVRAGGAADGDTRVLHHADGLRALRLVVPDHQEAAGGGAGVAGGAGAEPHVVGCVVRAADAAGVVRPGGR